LLKHHRGFITLEAEGDCGLYFYICLSYDKEQFVTWLIPELVWHLEMELWQLANFSQQLVIGRLSLSAARVMCYLKAR